MARTANRNARRDAAVNSVTLPPPGGGFDFDEGNELAAPDEADSEGGFSGGSDEDGGTAAAAGLSPMSLGRSTRRTRTPATVFFSLSAP